MPLSEHVYCVAVTFKMTEWVEQQICIKFCIKLELCSVETIWTIQKAFRDDAVSTVQIKAWHKCYKDGWECVENDPHSGRPETSRTPENAELVRAAVNKDWRTMWGPKVPTSEGARGVIVLCTMFLVSCIFFNKCLFFIVNGLILSVQALYSHICIECICLKLLTVIFPVKGRVWWNKSRRKIYF